MMLASSSPGPTSSFTLCFLVNRDVNSLLHILQLPVPSSHEFSMMDQNPLEWIQISNKIFKLLPSDIVVIETPKYPVCLHCCQLCDISQTLSLSNWKAQGHPDHQQAACHSLVASCTSFFYVFAVEFQSCKIVGSFFYRAEIQFSSSLKWL